MRQKKENLEISAGGVRDILLQATSYISANMKVSKENIAKIFIGLQFDNAVDKSSQVEEQEYINYVYEGISQMRKKLMKQDTQLRFSAHIINTAMSLYLRNRKSYDELRMSGLLCLPDPRHLRRISGKLKVSEGGDPMIYSMFQEEVEQRKSGHCSTLIGHLMLDKIKLKKQRMWIPSRSNRCDTYS